VAGKASGRQALRRTAAFAIRFFFEPAVIVDGDTVKPARWSLFELIRPHVGADEPALAANHAVVMMR
jgi:hypothetical protein